MIAMAVAPGHHENESFGLSMALPPVPQRLLATAFDEDWRMKKNLSKDCFPQSPKSRSLLLSPQSPSRLRSSARKRQVLPERSVSLANLPPRPDSAAGSRSPAMSSPVSRPSSIPAGGRKARSKTMKQSASLTAIGLAADSRPGSADSQKRHQAQRLVVNDLEDDGRTLLPFAEVAQLAGVPLDIARQALYVFLEFVVRPPLRSYKKTKEQVLGGTPFDPSTDLGSLDTEAFGRACLKIAEVSDFSALPDGFLIQAMRSADKDSSGDIDFREFLTFYYRFSFSEEVMVSPAEREIRLAARQHGLASDELAKYKREFSRVDTNKNGVIDYDEFLVFLNRLLKVPEGQELPEKRRKDMWRDALQSCHGDRNGLDFMSFVAWYKRYFASEEHADGESPFETFYHNIRRVPV